MKRKLMALILTLAMAVSFGSTAFASEISDPTNAMTINSTSLTLKAGATAALDVSVGGVPVEGVVWSSSNTAAATVSGGVVTAVAMGRATITASTSFGMSAVCAVQVALNGIDVSYRQGNIDWSLVKNSGVDFAIIRTGYGNELPEVQTDANFSVNYDGATASGIKVGVYHVCYATTADVAVQEAQMCLGILNKRHLDYPVFYDIEQEAHKSMTSDQLAVVVAAFCKTITNAGYSAAIYSNSSMYKTSLSSNALNMYDKWVAHYGVTSPSYTGAYTMWQYNDYGKVPGITPAVDLDYSFMNYPVNVATPASTPVDTSLTSDTGSKLNLKLGKSYQFKFTPKGTNTNPSFSTGNSRVLKIVSIKKQGNSYYVKVTAVGRGGTAVYSAFPKKKAVSRCAVTVS